ncbi:MAG TPA: glycogen debranching enzyme GlgX, partial [Burkholderiaceae bacterium]|nr:glycogen debranching enzyme GlgX [Burkholderiaceae bacterium]
METLLKPDTPPVFAAPGRPLVPPPHLPPTLGEGRPWPIGAHWDGSGINFAVFSANAQAIELCLFDADGTHELARVPLPGHSGEIWHGRLDGAAPGLVYGLRVHGPWRPDQGHKFNPAKLLLDPYAREIVGRFDWSGPHFAAARDNPGQIDTVDNAAGALKARVTHEPVDWSGD